MLYGKAKFSTEQKFGFFPKKLQFKTERMSKRRATTTLTRDNWDEEEPEDEKEQVGKMPVASNDELGKRVIISAKRRAINSKSSENGSGAFSSFAGFGRPAAAASIGLTPSPAFDQSFKKPVSTAATSTTSFPSFQAKPVNTGFGFGTKSSTDESGFGKKSESTGFGAKLDIGTGSAFGSSLSKPDNTGFGFGWNLDNSGSSIIPDVKKTSTLLLSKYPESSSGFSPDVTASNAGADTVAQVPPHIQIQAKHVTNGGGGGNGESTNNVFDETHPLCKHLKVLNHGVLNWIQKHLKTNPYLDLTPVFEDYIKHYKNLEEKFCSTSKTGTFGNSPSTFKSKNENGGDKKIAEEKTVSFGDKPKSFSFGISPITTTTTTSSVANQSINVSSFFTPPTNAGSFFQQPLGTLPTTKAVTFGFGLLDKTDSGETAKKTFSFGQQNSSSTSTTTTNSFSFTPKFGSSSTTGSNQEFGSITTGGGDQQDSTQSSFGPGFFTTSSSTASLDSQDTEKTDDKDEEYQPPEVDSAVVEEKDAFHSVKCKLFYKSGEQFVQRGLGMLYLKPLESGKIQLLIRADTSLGNILLNVSLNESMRISRTGKNNVSLFCVPNPLDPKIWKAAAPVMFLIRVRTEDEADVLLEKMTKKADSE